MFKHSDTTTIPREHQSFYFGVTFRALILKVTKGNKMLGINCRLYYACLSDPLGCMMSQVPIIDI